MTIAFSRVSSFSAAVLLAAAALAAPACAKDFVFDEKTNADLAKKLNIPVFFAVPSSARAPLSGNFDTPDKLLEFRHPGGAGAEGRIGLRIYSGKRAGIAKRLGKSGLVQTGDLLLSMRSEWGGAGAYPNIQMGITHVGLAYVKNGAVHNLDNPMNAEFLGSRLTGDLDGSHYRSIKLIHVIRPRNLSQGQRDRLYAWATRLAGDVRRVYPKQISFNQDYNAPKYAPGKPVTFVKHVGQVALAQNPPGAVDLYCSEFVWSLLALKDCDMTASGDAFKAAGMPSCVKPAMLPMRAAGDYMNGRGRSSYAGLAEGPLLVIDAMKLAPEKRNELLKDVFEENPAALAKMSPGHKAVAEKMSEKFKLLENYYLGIGSWPGLQARIIRRRFNQAVPENYSPTSFLINTLLPADNVNRTMDYVATIVME